MLARIKKRLKLLLKRCFLFVVDEVNPYDGVTFLRPIPVDVVSKIYSEHKNFPDFTVVIPVKNEESDIDAFLENLDSQSLCPKEVIFVDHDSTDSTARHILNYKERTTKFKVTLLQSRNSRQFDLTGRSSVAGNRNFGVDVSSTEHIVFVDVGNSLNHNLFASLIGPFVEDRDVDLVGGIYKTQSVELDKYFTFDWDSVDWQTFIPGSRCVAFKKSIYRECGGQPEFLTYAGEDVLFDYNYRRYSKKWVFNKAAQVIWKAPSTELSMARKFFSYGIGDGENGLGVPRFDEISSFIGKHLSLPDYAISNPIFAYMYFGFLYARHSRGAIDSFRKITAYKVLICDKHPRYSVSTRKKICNMLSDKNCRVFCLYFRDKSVSSFEDIYLGVDPSRLDLISTKNFSFPNFLQLSMHNKELRSIDCYVELGNYSEKCTVYYNKLQNLLEIFLRSKENFQSI